MDGSFHAQTGKVRPSQVGAGGFHGMLMDHPQTGFVLEVRADAVPVWITEVVRRLNIAVAAAASEPGWPPITNTAIVRGLQTLRSVMSADSSRPSLAPTPAGGLQFEWHDAGWDIEIEVEPDGTAETWGRHLHNGTTFDGAIANTADRVRVALKDITLHHPACGG